MTDIHTHILPGIDDGSGSIEETSKMLDLMKADGVNTVVATPHFYNEISVDEFCGKRKESFNSLKDILDGTVDVRLGAEVALEYGLHKVPGLGRLAIEGSGHMLIEPPYSKWDSWVYDELFKIAAKFGVDIIIAHAERFRRFNSIDKIERLKEMDFRIQVNVDDLGTLFRKSDAVDLMKRGLVDFIASDCHNTETRKPNLGAAYKKISSKMGSEYAERMMKNAEKMLG